MIFQVSLGFKHLKLPLSILLIGLISCIIIVMLEKFLKSHLKKNNEKTEPLRQTQGCIREIVLEYFKSNDIQSKNDQVKQLKKFFDLSLKIIQNGKKKIH